MLKSSVEGGYRAAVLKKVKYRARNPWPEPQEIPNLPSKVQRVWVLTIEKSIISDEKLQELHQHFTKGSCGVEIRCTKGTLLNVAIYSPHPDIADPLETIVETSKILKEFDRHFHITHIQGVAKEEWLIMK